MRASGAIAAAALLAACTVLDGRPDVSLEVHTRFATGQIEVTVHAGGADTAALLVDGEDRGNPVDVGVRTVVSVDDLAEGTHRVRARLRGTVYPVESADVEFTVDRTGPTIEVDPAPGRLRDFEPIVDVRVADPAGLAEGRVTVWPDSPGTVTRIDANTWRLAIDPLQSGPLSFQVHAFDALGNRTIASYGYWEPRSLGAAFVRGEYPPRPVSGVVTTSATFASPPADLTVSLHVGGAKLGETRSPGSVWSIEWDTRRLSDGDHALRLFSVGYWPEIASSSIRVDNTPPVITGCSADPAWAADGFAIGASIRLIVNEPLSSTSWPLPTMEVDGVPVAFRFGDGVFRLDGPVAVPSTLVLDLPTGSVRDVAGNSAAPASCTFAIPAWVHPLGPGPVREAGNAIAARRAAAVMRSWGVPELDLLLWIVADGLDGAGELRSPEGVHNVEAGSIATEVLPGANESVAWIERSGAGPGHVYRETFWGSAGASPAGPLNLDPAADARDLATPLEWTPSPWIPEPSLAWSEATPEGGRAIVVYSDRAVRITDPTHVATSPALDDHSVAFVERTGSETAKLRVTDDAGVDVGVPPLNADAALDASEPVVWEGGYGVPGFVAWIEGGRLLARMRVPWGATGWTEPQVLNADPLHPARSPRLLPGLGLDAAWVVFVEDVGTRDEIQVREFDGASWKVVSSANEGVDGRVSSLNVFGESPRTVTWTDERGHVYVRAFNVW